MNNTNDDDDDDDDHDFVTFTVTFVTNLNERFRMFAQKNNFLERERGGKKQKDR